MKRMGMIFVIKEGVDLTDWVVFRGRFNHPLLFNGVCLTDWVVLPCMFNRLGCFGAIT